MEMAIGQRVLEWHSGILGSLKVLSPCVHMLEGYERKTY